MKIYQLYVPITNYEGNGIFNQEMFIVSDIPVSSARWLMYAEQLHIRDKQYPEYLGTWIEVKDTIERAILSKEFPSLTGNCVQTNGFVETQKFGKQPITIRQVEYFKVLS